MDLEERFWSKVRKTGRKPKHRPELGRCWLWAGGRRNGGYGEFWVAGKVRTAHRVAYELSSGQSLAATDVVIHECDEPRCCRPDHLRKADQAANIRDMHSKGRAVVLRGEGSRWRRRRELAGLRGPRPRPAAPARKRAAP